MILPFFEDDWATVWAGDCLDILRALPDETVDAVITDPPYALGFMGEDWDCPATLGQGCDRRGDLGAFQEWCTAWSSECLRLLRPGGHLLAFGAPRTWHRLAVGVEDAGFEIRDSIAWLNGQGFPKSLDVAKAITASAGGYGANSRAPRKMVMGDDYKPSGVRGNRDGVTRRSDTGMAGRSVELADEALPWQGWGTALKPAHEPIVVARKPLDGTVATNVLEHGVGALNIDACRVPMSRADAATIDAKHAGMDVGAYERRPGASLRLSTDPIPLKPARAHECGRWPTNVVLDDVAAGALDRQSGNSVSRQGRSRSAAPGVGWGMRSTGAEYDDAGGASRFFPAFRWEPKAPASERPAVDGVQHPTVKPLGLMRWLVRLVTPYGGVVLDPFAGSGTTVEAALAEGMRCIAIEREPQYLPLIRERISRTREVPLDLWGGDGS